MSDLLVGGIVGALMICAVFTAAHKLGLIHISMGSEREAFAAAAPVQETRRAFPRIGSSVTVEPKNELSTGLRPQVRLFATVENEGEIVIRSLKGLWKVVTPDNYKHPLVRIQRDLLPPKDKYLESYLLDEGINSGEGIRFDVEIEFDYSSENDLESRHYSAKYRYDRKAHRMIKL